MNMKQIITRKYLNPDSATMPRERLTQDTLREVTEWYRSPEGGDTGRALLLRAPLCDTAMEVGVPPTSDIAPDHRASASQCFGYGLLIGAQIEHVATETGAHGIFGFEEVIAGLGQVPHLPDFLTNGNPQVDLHNEVVTGLLALDPSLDLSILTGFRLATAGMHGNEPNCKPHYRLLFFMGLAAAGVPVTGGIAVDPDQTSTRGRQA